MTDREALLRSVCENPDDDLARLVFADWLDEHDEPERAEFIRVQIELSGAVKGKRRELLKARERALIEEHAERWVAELRDYIDDNFTIPWHDYFRRGFVEQIPVLGETLVEAGSELFAQAPIREVWLADEEDYDELAKCPHLLRLRVIDLEMAGLSEGFGPAKLFRSRYLAKLRTLHACGYDDNCHLDIPGIRGIVTSKHLGNLTHLDLSCNWFGAAGTRELLKAANLTSLDRLEFEGVGMGDEGAIALAATPWMTQIKSLNLVANDIGEAGARAILESPHLSGLTEIDLRDNESAYEDHTPITQATKRQLQARYGKGLLI